MAKAAENAQIEAVAAMMASNAASMKDLTDARNTMKVETGKTNAAVSLLGDRQLQMEAQMQQMAVVKGDAAFRTASQRKRKQDGKKSTEEEGAFADPEPDQWEVRMPDATEEWRQKAATKGDIVDLIQQAIHNVIAPGVLALFGSVKEKVKKMESDIHSLKIRTSWMEQDVMKVQADTARTQLIIRNWPTDSTEKDRAASADAFCK
jgi:hypothetical protein